MTKADKIFKENIERILNEGVFSEQARPKYKDGTVANSKYITGAFAEYDLSKGEFPITPYVQLLSNQLSRKFFGFIKTRQIA